MMKGRLLLCALVMVVALLLLVLRLWQVQVMQGPEHLEKTKRQSIRPIRINPIRGRIFDRNGEVLADNAAQYDIEFHVSEMRQPGRQNRTIIHIMATAARLSLLLNRPSPLTEAMLLKHLNQKPALPLVVFKNLSAEERARFAELSPPLVGVDLAPRTVRVYPHEGLASHVLGFTGNRQPQLDDMGDFARIYVTREIGGREGLELQYDSELSGHGGAQLVLVDTSGYVHEVLHESRAPQAGNNLHLTLDTRAQAAAETALRGHFGALVAVDVHTGAILAMASAPAYRHDLITAQLYREWQADTVRKPMFNRALNNTYTPGSIVKPLVALAALHSGRLTPDDPYYCNGYYMIGDHPIHCAKRSGHGNLDLREAIIVSCNPYFIGIGVKTGLDNLAPMFAAAGIGEKTGIDLPETTSGLLPSRAFAKMAWHRNWLVIDTAYVSMGQGAIDVTPLQAAIYTAALANGGKVLRPYLVQRVTDNRGKVLRNASVEIRHRLPATEEELAIVRQGMEGTVTSPHGSAKAMKEAGIPLAAKTGTAEIGSKDNRKKNTWIICYGPLPEPTIAVACVIENGDSGGRTTAPVVSRFFRLLNGETE